MWKLTREVVKVINPDPCKFGTRATRTCLSSEVVSYKEHQGAYEAMRFHAIKIGQRLITLEKSFREATAFQSPDIKARVLPSQADKKKRPAARSISRLPIS